MLFSIYRHRNDEQVKLSRIIVELFDNSQFSFFLVEREMGLITDCQLFSGSIHYWVVNWWVELLSIHPHAESKFTSNVCILSLECVNSTKFVLKTKWIQYCEFSFGILKNAIVSWNITSSYSSWDGGFVM